MVGRNGPPLPGWTVNPRACPFDIADCPICPTSFEDAGTLSPLIELGEN